jgi:acyl-CoA synthetase (AMP-forming)/AMP-acid ligase II
VESDKRLEPRTIGEIARVNAQRMPSAEAVVDGDRRLSWAELYERTNRVANALSSELALGPGDRIAYLGHSCIEAFELLHAVPRLGAIFVPLNERLAVAELQRIVGSTEPTALIHDAGFADLAAELASGAGVPRIGVRSSGPYNYDELASLGSPDDPAVVVEADDIASICFTSGTTGSPKGVLMRHGAQLAFARAETALEPILPGARHLFVRPLSVAPGHRLAAWHGLGGGTTVLLPRFSPAEFFRFVERERITNVLLAPTTLRMLLDEGNSQEHDLSSLRTIVYGGAPMSSELLAEVLAFFPCDLLQGYGSSEAGQALYLSDDDHRSGRLQTNGRPVPGVELSIRDEHGREVADGEVGELHVRSEQLAAGYWRDPSKTAAAFRADWYRTGDLCTRSTDGLYCIAGRTSDMIISGGFNIMPGEVENVLATHTAVREVAVYGVADRTWGEAVHAAVVLEPGEHVPADELVALCRAKLASFKKPREIVFVDALPLTAAGKVDKVALAARAAGLTASSTGPTDASLGSTPR